MFCWLNIRMLSQNANKISYLRRRLHGITLALRRRSHGMARREDE
jgi:hypothetical protein